MHLWEGAKPKQMGRYRALASVLRILLHEIKKPDASFNYVIEPQSQISDSSPESEDRPPS